MSELLRYSMLHQVFFPVDAEQDANEAADLRLQRVLRHGLSGQAKVRDIPLVVFDFETTGLDMVSDRIIEIGALKILNGQIVDQFSTFIDPEIPLPAVATKITGITPDMLVGQPKIDAMLPQFMKFFAGALLIAHNAEFDMGFLTRSAQRQGIELHWPCFCTLKLARGLLPQLESKNLDTLANHYQLTFEARHRSIGDCKVTWGVLQRMWAQEGGHLVTWQDMAPFSVSNGLAS